MSKGMICDRRGFISAASLTIAASGLTLTGFSQSESENLKRAQTKWNEPDVKTSGANQSFGPLKQIAAGVLNVGYADEGPANGPVVVLLHGWPYDIYSFVDVSRLLTAKGYGSSFRIYADMAAQDFFQLTRCGMGSNL